MNYHITTYGCAMNVHESEKLSGMLNAFGYAKTEKIEQADIILFNTCSIREGAVKKLFGNIGALKKLKQNNGDIIIGICGCATQNKKDAEYISKRFPFVDILFGTHNIHRLNELIEERKRKKKQIIEIWDAEAEEFFDLPILRNNKITANVNIMYGCNNFCSYCIVPYVRGRERSRGVGDILSEVKDAVSAGAKEIMLLGQNVNSYGNDVNASVNFAGLLSQICRIEGKFRVKFMTSHPKDFSDELIDVIKDNAKISKHIHLPVQSGSNNVLYAMNRKYTREHYLDLIEKIRNKIPDATISSDIIVGFPNETEEDFLDTLSLTEKACYSGIYAFIFSPRFGTKAYNIPDVTPENVKSERLTRLLELQRGISKKIAQKKLGNTYEVLCVSDGANKPVALTEADEVINLDRYSEGEFMKVRVTSIKNSRLFGEVI